MKYRNPARWTASVDLDPEVPTMPSETVPDMAMPLKELIDRYSRGQPVELYQPLYDDDLPEEFAGLDLAKMTKLDILELRNDIRNNIRTLQDAIQEQQAETARQAKAEPLPSDDSPTEPE
jgi:trans-2-enoyl-CoA reductase